MKSTFKYILFFSLFIITNSIFANPTSTTTRPTIQLEKLPGFFRFSYENVKMPQNYHNAGLLGINYFAEITPLIYAGVGGYGAVTGGQGGLFVLGVGGGIQPKIATHWQGDLGLYVGGGGGKSALVGGGLMLKPYVGLNFVAEKFRLGLYYSYINFPSGKIRSSQVGVNLDLPFDLYYTSFSRMGQTFYNPSDILFADGKFLNWQRNDFGILLQGYKQLSGTQDISGTPQTSTIGLAGAEFDHYLTDRMLWWMRADGAFRGIHNGYMDVLGGLGYRLPLGCQGFALMTQAGVGGGGGGNVDTKGGFLVQPQIGIEIPLTRKIATRVMGGYLWAPQGHFKVATMTGEIIYHLNVATSGATPGTDMFSLPYSVRGWRVQLLNQTYIHPQRATNVSSSRVNLFALQFDQMFTPSFFMTYQAASAYQGDHIGGYASGMIGSGLQLPTKPNRPWQPFAEILVGAGGGGGLSLKGGALIEPVVGLRYEVTPCVGVQASYGQLKALNAGLSTPVISVGLSLQFGILE